MFKTNKQITKVQLTNGQVNRRKWFCSFGVSTLSTPCVNSLPYFNLFHLCHPSFREASTFTVRGEQRIGPKYKKVVYREYTSPLFTKEKTRTADESHLGVLGPMLHAEVGDTIEVTFKNMASGKFSMHPHGLFYRYAWTLKNLYYPGPVFGLKKCLHKLLPRKIIHSLKVRKCSRKLPNRPSP